MLRARFHGRGGQGIKTAGQILGSAAFFAGYQAQDFPLYGAERRGAPIVAYTRFDRETVRERGAIARPDLLLIGDETLLADPLAAPTGGADERTVMFINSPRDPDALKAHYHLPSLPAAADLTDLCIHYLNQGMILSTALAAAAARLTGVIELRFLVQAVRTELSQQGIDENMLVRNLELVSRVFAELTPLPIYKRKETIPTAGRLAMPPHKEVSAAAPVIFAAANMAMRKTGNWRTQRPEIDYEVCNQCGICFARCPDSAMSLRPDGNPDIDYEHCKGCLICLVECPTHAIQAFRETVSWT
ncbi:MAG: 2-oxoacid:acceptor oxidoreductase family protein [Nitrospinales bacterium]